MRALIFGTFVCLLGSAAWADAPVAVPTFHNISVYWPNMPAPTTNGDAKMEYRKTGTSTYKAAIPLWYDSRTKEYKGSILQLTSGTSYDIRLTHDNGTVASLKSSTWSQNFPIAKTITLPETSASTLNITISGSPTGYVLYAPAPGRPAVIDVKKAADFNVVVKAKYVIIRGLTLKGAKHSGILLGATTASNTSDVTDVVIENNDISAWGTNGTIDAACAAEHGVTKAYGINLQSAVFARSSLLQRIIIQRNKMHHPSTNANSWKEQNCSVGGAMSMHPQGPQAVSIFGSLGRLVIRYNEIYSDATHYFNDGMGETNNFSDKGFPGRDSDIYGNLIRNVWDDTIEAEGGDRNVRIYGNYLDQFYIAIGLAAVHQGPMYVFRNVANLSRTAPTASYGQTFIKTRNHSDGTAGKTYVMHNTILQPADGSAVQSVLSEYDTANKIQNYYVRNNVFQVEKPSSQYVFRDIHGVGNSYDYNLVNGKVTISTPGQQAHGQTGAPVFLADNGFNEATKVGKFYLAASSKGYNQGMVIPNVSDGYVGAAPDMGAHENGAAAMEFGIKASQLIPVGSGLIGLWRFDETATTAGTANDFADSSNSKIFGDAVGSVTLGQAGVVNTGIGINGSGAGVNLSASSVFNFGTTDFSVALWMRNNGSVDGAMLISKYGADSTPSFALQILGGHLRGFIRDGAGGTTADLVFVTGAAVINDGKWHHVAATYSRKGNLSLYVDGKLDKAGSIATVTGSINNTSPLYLGRRGVTDTRYFKGSFDEVGVWNRALTAAEVKVIYGR